MLHAALPGCRSKLGTPAATHQNSVSSLCPPQVRESDFNEGFQAGVLFLSLESFCWVLSAACSVPIFSWRWHGCLLFLCLK